jgi:parallel beta-helix repeat protein
LPHLIFILSKKYYILKYFIVVLCQRCEVKNCTITDCGVGVLIKDGAMSNVVQNNSVFGNTGDGIVISDPASTWNAIIGNRMFKNGGAGILNMFDAANQFFENASCNNGGANCTGIPAALALPPGSPAVIGGNICCQ